MTKRLVIYRLGSLGDTIVALPCLNKVRDAFPDHERIALTNFPVSSKAAPLESILGAGDFIHGAVPYRIGVRRPDELLRLADDLRKLEADTLIYLGGGRGLKAVHRDVLFFRFSGFRRIIGAPLTRDLENNRIDPESGEIEPEASRLARCLSELGPIDLDTPAAWDLRLTESEQAAGRSVMAALGGVASIAVNTGGKVIEKDWGEPNWLELVPRLAAGRRGVALVFVGGAEDQERAVRLAALWPGPTLNLCGKLSPRETAAALSHSTIFLGHDSGPMHLASAVGVPCVGLFGVINRPKKWHPYGTRHLVLHDTTDVRRIPVQSVVEAAGALLDPRLKAHAV